MMAYFMLSTIIEEMVPIIIGICVAANLIQAIGNLAEPMKGCI
jgi:hypothetical protein